MVHVYKYYYVFGAHINNSADTKSMEILLEHWTIVLEVFIILSEFKFYKVSVEAQNELIWSYYDFESMSCHSRWWKQTCRKCINSSILPSSDTIRGWY